MWKKRVRVGDLVKCEFNGDELGLILKIEGYGFHIWIRNRTIFYFRNQLEVISENR